MQNEPYDYKLLAAHPKLISFYTGWLGQKIYALGYSAVGTDRHELWSTAVGEVDRLVLVLQEAGKAKHLKLSGEIGLAMGELLARFSDGGWWTSAEGTGERAAHREERRELEEFPDYEPDTSGLPFQPQLVLERGAAYPVAAPAINALDSALMKVAGAMNALDVSRLGVLLAGFCYRSTPQLDVGFVNSVLNDLAAHGLTDLQAENEFRRTVGLSEVAEDRRPLSIVHPTPMPAPCLPADGPGVLGGQDPFARDLRSLQDHSDLILACVFRRFDLAVPPGESDAVRHPGLPAIKKALQERLIAQAAGGPDASSAGEKIGTAEDRSSQSELWAQEAIEYLGLNRLDLSRPDMALQRLIKKGALKPTKISGRLVFKKDELDRVLEKGDEVRGRGRPRKDGK